MRDAIRSSSIAKRNTHNILINFFKKFKRQWIFSPFGRLFARFLPTISFVSPQDVNLSWGEGVRVSEIAVMYVR